MSDQPAAPLPARPEEMIRLVPLLCVQCKAPVPARPDEVAWVCETCGRGLLLDTAPKPGLGECGTQPLDIFFSNAVTPGAQGHPFWVARGQVNLTMRETYKGDEGRAAREFWSAPHLFFIPAWETSLEETIKMGVSLLRTPQRMDPGGRVPFLSVVTPPGDVRSLADFIVINIEADRKDYLRTVKFDLNLDPLQ